MHYCEKHMYMGTADRTPLLPFHQSCMICAKLCPVFTPPS